MEYTMKIYTISELETLNKAEIAAIVKERSELLLLLLEKVLKGHEITPYMDKKTEKENEEEVFKINTIQVTNSTKGLDVNDSILLGLEMSPMLYNNNNSKDIIFSEEQATQQLNDLLREVVDKRCRLLWTAEKPPKKNAIQVRLLFPNNLILPELVRYEEYKEKSKKLKKPLKEKYTSEIEAKIVSDVENLQNNRFNIFKNDPFFVPEDKKELMEFIKKSNKIFDKEAIKNIVKKYPDDEEIVMKAIFLFNDSVFSYVSDRLKNDRKFIFKMMEQNVNILEYGPEKYKNDDEIMYKAIGISGYIARIASDRLKNDKQFCLTAIKSQSDAYSVLPQNMRADNDLLAEAMKDRGEFLMYSPEVKTNKELLIKAFSNAFDRQSRNLLVLTSEELRNDKEVALAAIKCFSENIWEISKELREEIGENDPIEYLTQQLENDSNKKSAKNKPKI